MQRREHHSESQRGREIVRGLHADELREAGAARRAALKAADDQLDRIARLMPAALKGGLSVSEIGRLTGVSRPTLYELRARYGDSVADVRFALLQTLATTPALNADEVERHLGGPRPVLSEIVKELKAHNVLDYEVEDGEEGPVLFYELTDKGFDLLEHWSFEAAEAEEA